MKYLYGASVKKIQEYIFETSKLREIAGASEIVEQICTKLFDDFIGNSHDVEKIISAAGNIRAIIKSEEMARQIMKSFPKCVLEMAPGIKFVQSAIIIEGDEISKSDTERLELELGKQIPMVSPYKDWSIIKKAPRTGKPAVASDKDGLIDAGTQGKLNAVEKHWRNLEIKFSVTEESFPSDTDDIAGIGNFVAVIHADGNSLGQTLMNLPSHEGYEQSWRDFSIELDQATREAACTAYNDVFVQNKCNKFRPIIIGGDDLTVVCAAEYAVPFVCRYLKVFEEASSKRPNLSRYSKGGKLTACAGIGFIKKNFPFFYGVDLAEMMCAQTKKVAKKTLISGCVPSSLMFAMEVGGYVDSSFETMKKRTLEAGNYHFAFGPYCIDENCALPFIYDLLKATDITCQYSPLKSGCRKLISQLYISAESSKLLADRIEQVAIQNKQEDTIKDFITYLGKLTRKNDSKHLWDVLGMVDQEENKIMSPLEDILTLGKLNRNEK